ncbi:MAG: hypothetical protein QXJ17_00470 [Nitrososphaeria archaeon]
MHVKIFLSGIHSRSEDLIDKTRNYEKGLTSYSELEDAFKSDTSKLIKLQLSLRFYAISDGSLKWQDPIRPFIESLEGVRLGGYSRWFKTNTFYRKPVIYKRISLKEEVFPNYCFNYLIPSDQIRLIMLPGPFTLSTLSTNHYYNNFNELMCAYSNALSDLLKRVGGGRRFLLVLQEPSLAYEDLKPRLTQFSKIREALSIITDLSSDTVIHTFFGDIRDIISLFAGMETATIGLDLVETPLDHIDSFKVRRFAFGILNSFNPFREPKSFIRQCNELFRRLDLEEISLMPNTDLRYLPRPYADRKLNELSLLKKKLEVV